MEKLFKMVEPGTDKLVHGPVGRDNAQLLTMVDRIDGPAIDALKVGEGTTAHFRSSGATGVYRVVRVQ